MSSCFGNTHKHFHCDSHFIKRDLSQLSASGIHNLHSNFANVPKLFDGKCQRTDLGLVCVYACRPVDTLRQTLEVNVIGVHAMIQAFLPLLQSGQKKTVVNISSGSGSLSRRYDEVCPHTASCSSCCLMQANQLYQSGSGLGVYLSRVSRVHPEIGTVQDTNMLVLKPL